MVKHLEILNWGGRRIRFAYPGTEAWEDKGATWSWGLSWGKGGSAALWMQAKTEISEGDWQEAEFRSEEEGASSQCCPVWLGRAASPCWDFLSQLGWACLPLGSTPPLFSSLTFLPLHWPSSQQECLAPGFWHVWLLVFRAQPKYRFQELLWPSF